jgi:CRISPR system Cascade subunit CasD
MNKFLLLWVEAPLQSWGYDSKFGRRNTAPFPTKSGILGLLCSASGLMGEQRELLFKMSGMKQKVISFIKENEENFNLTDFHMVGSGYGKTEWEKLMSPKKLNGEKVSNSTGEEGSKRTYRDYLQNAKFSVILEVPENLVSIFSDGLNNPVFPIFFGRKSCIPSEFIFKGIFETEHDSENRALSIASEKNLHKKFEVIDGEFENLGRTMLLNDIPISFGDEKKYKERGVTIIE